MRAILILGILVAIAGCGDDGAGSGGAAATTTTEASGTTMSGTTTSTGSSSGGLSLTVESSKTQSKIGVSTAKAGNTFLVLSITLANTDFPEGVPTDLNFYSIDLASNISLGWAPASASLPDVCNANVKVNAGGMVTCSAAFEIPSNDTATVAHYDNPILMVAAQGDVPMTMMGGTPCVNACTKLQQVGMTLGCDATIDQGCLANCMANYTDYPNCKMQLDTLFNCVALNVQASSCSCDPDLGTVCDGICQAETDDAFTCINM
jgi:hypothetical protein